MNMVGMRIAMGLAAVCWCGSVAAQNTKSADKTFLAVSDEGSLAEIDYAKLALEKSQDKNVRDFATKMIAEHQTMIESMKPFMVKYHAKPAGPAIIHHVKYDELKSHSGAAFDKAYITAMVKDHHADLKNFITEEQKTSDPELKEAVAKGEKTVREHTEMIDNLASIHGIKAPPMP